MELPKKDKNGRYPKLAWPGGYPFYYMDKAGNVLCTECANREVDFSQEVVASDIYWEGEPMICEDCGEEIESAYGEAEGGRG